MSDDGRIRLSGSSEGYYDADTRFGIRAGTPTSGLLTGRISIGPSSARAKRRISRAPWCTARFLRELPVAAGFGENGELHGYTLLVISGQ